MQRQVWAVGESLLTVALSLIKIFLMIKIAFGIRKGFTFEGWHICLSAQLKVTKWKVQEWVEVYPGEVRLLFTLWQ